MGPGDSLNTRRDNLIHRPAVLGRPYAGFTLVEMLVTITIIATLLSLVAPQLARTLGAARSFRCQMTLRSAGFDFLLFSDSNLGPDRGDDSDLSGDRFHIATFQESLYGVHEFWRWGRSSRVVIEDSDRVPLRCSEVDGPLTLVKDMPCTTSGAIGPASAISYTFNARLDRRDDGREVMIGAATDTKADVPLLWDVDGAAARSRGGVNPVFSAPGLGTDGVYRGDRLWFPAMRHNGAGNFAFIDGHVASSSQPLGEEWDWSYAPR